MAGISSVENGKKGGRPKGKVAKHTLEAEKLREFFIAKVAERVERLVPPLLDLAEGLYYEKKTDDGVVNVYKEKPDINAAKYIFDQGIGKPTETVKIRSQIELKMDL